MGSDNRSSRPKGRRQGAIGVLLNGIDRAPPLNSTTLLLIVLFAIPSLILLMGYSLSENLPRSSGEHALPFQEDHGGHRSNPSKSHHKNAEKVHHLISKPTLPSDSTRVPEGCKDKHCPVVEMISPSHGLASGGLTITISGTNLGTAASLRSVSVGGQTCASFQSLSSSSLTCVTPKGTGAQLAVEVVVSTAAGAVLTSPNSSEARFSYDPPTVTGVEPSHGPRAGGHTLLIRGRNFGSTESFPVATIGGVVCQATSWLSDSTLQCVLPQGQGVDLQVRVLVCGCGEAVKSAQSSSANGEVLFSYDEDTMLRAGPDLLKDLQLAPPNSPLVVNRKQMTQDYEVSFVDPTTNERHYFAVPPELASVVPADDFRHRYDTCALVGNSGSLLHSGLGGAIDDHDAVFRFHNAPLHRFETHVGARTTFMVLDHYWMETLMNNKNELAEARWWSDEATLVLWSPFSQEAYVQLRQLYPTNSIVFLSRNLVVGGASLRRAMQSRIEEAMSARSPAGKEPSSMWYATLFALRACRQVDVYGMDFRSGKYHYFEEYDPGDDVRAVHSMEFLMMLGMHASRLVHHVQVAEPKALGDEGEVLGVEGAPAREATCEERECTNDCSYRGIWRNTTCECEPIYAGSDCSINLMEKSIVQLLAGLNTTYSGPIVMNKQEVNGSALNGGFIPLPKGITRQKLREGDIYRVDRQLYNVLPDEDLHERYGTCAIVGNSGSMLNTEYGRAIDAHDLVYRFNQAPVQGYESHVGSRSTFESLNGYWVKELMDEKRGYRWNWRSRDTGVLLFELFEPWAFIWKTKTQIYEKDKWWKATYVKLRKTHVDRKVIALSPQFVSWSYLMYRELRRRFQRMRLGHYPGEKPMSGFYSFFFALQMCESLDVYGFAPYREPAETGIAMKYHYFDGAVPRPGSHSFDLAHYIYHLFALQHDHVRIHS